MDSIEIDGIEFEVPAEPMTRDEQIRAVALQAAAATGIKVGPYSKPTAHNVDLIDRVLTTARKYETYIREGTQ